MQVTSIEYVARHWQPQRRGRVENVALYFETALGTALAQSRSVLCTLYHCSTVHWNIDSDLVHCSRRRRKERDLQVGGMDRLKSLL